MTCTLGLILFCDLFSSFFPTFLLIHSSIFSLISLLYISAISPLPSLLFLLFILPSSTLPFFLSSSVSFFPFYLSTQPLFSPYFSFLDNLVGCLGLLKQRGWCSMSWTCSGFPLSKHGDSMKGKPEAEAEAEGKGKDGKRKQ